MVFYEYKVIPAPTKGLKAKGIKTPADRFAHALESAMNTLGAEGWEYLRADTLPATQRSGLTGSTTEWRHMLVFRRALDATEDTAADVSEDTQPAPALLAAPVSEAVTGATEGQEAAGQDVEDPIENDDGTAPHPDDAIPGYGATQMFSDNGVEETSDVAGMSSSLQSLARNRGTDKPDTD